MPTEAPVATSHGTLQVWWSESSAQHSADIHLDQITDEVQALGLFVSLASAIANEFKPDADVFERARPFQPVVRQLRFGSPLFIEVELFREVTEGTAALAFLAFALKRAWGFDLELKTHREKMRERFLRAKRRADRAQEVIEQHESAPGFGGPLSERVAHDEGWGDGAADIPAGVRRAWDGSRATMRIDYDDE